MPSTEAILSSAAAIANGWRALAIAWHVAIILLVAAIALGWRPSHRLLGLLLAVPLVSVSALAWTSGNPFNGTTFALLALMVASIAMRLSKQPVDPASATNLTSGVLLFVFGWIYPHFLRADSWIEYAYAAPLGLLPCPTLAAVLGITLLAGLFRSAAWTTTVAAAAFAYGSIGVFALGVSLDYALILGAAILVIAGGRTALTQRESRIIITHVPARRSAV